MADSAAILLDKLNKLVKESVVSGSIIPDKISELYRATYKEAYDQALRDQKEKCGCEPLDPDAVNVDADDDGDTDGSDMWGV